MTKLYVKKPYLVLVTIVIVLTIGIVSLNKMNTDLMPEMELPYLGVIVTDVGASPEQVEKDVIQQIESALSTISGTKNVTSMCAENFGAVFLEFSDGTDMDATLVRVSQKLATLELPATCGTPNLMEISMDMMATMYVNVNCEGMDIVELTTFVENEVKPYLEKQNGVASVSLMGAVNEYVEVRLNQEKIDALNAGISEFYMQAMAQEAAAQMQQTGIDPSAEGMSADMMAGMDDATGEMPADAMAGTDDATDEMPADAMAGMDDATGEMPEMDFGLDEYFTMDTISGLITAQDFAMPAGYISDNNGNQWLLEAGDHYDSVDDIQDFVITSMEGYGDIKLSDVADITILDTSNHTYSKLNGEDSITISIFKNSTASTGAVSDTIIDAFEDLEASHEGFTYSIAMNQGDYIDKIIESVLSSILLGAILAIIVLALFMKDVRPTIVVAFSIPFSVLFAIVVMYFTNININVMSLAGLCIGIGMLVDNSIVVMENVYRLRMQGYSPVKAAVYGAKQVAGAIIASTITTICVFLPMVYTSGIVKQLLVPFAFTMSYALIASLLVALTVVPTMGAVLLKKEKKQNHKIFDAIKNAYGKSLSFCLRFKVVPILISVALLVFCVIKISSTGLNMMDDMESDQISASIKLKEGTDDETALAIADETMERILNVDGVKMVSARDGSGSAMASSFGMTVEGDFSSFEINILAEDDVKTTAEYKDLMAEIEKAVEGVDYEEFKVSSSAMGASGSSMLSSGMQVNIYGNDEDAMIRASEDVMAMMAEIEGIKDITNGLEDADTKLHLTFDKQKVISCGITVAQIYQQVATKLQTSKDSILLSMDDTDLQVTVVDDRNVLTYETLMDTEIVTTSMATGEEVTYKLSDFAKVEEKKAMNTISRTNQVRYMSISAMADEGYNVTLLSRELQKKIDDYTPANGIKVEIQGEAEQVNQMIKQMVLAIALGFLLIYLVMVAQFQSLLSPFIIIFTVPLAFTGGMLGLMIFGRTISAMSLMGFMILMGTVVNNGIVFVDFVNKLRMKGVERRQALIITGKTRMRPIIMTALTTILSMSVMVFSQDAGNAMQKSMAIVVCVGLLYATLMTLFIVPVLYDIMYKKQPKNIDLGDADDIEDETDALIKESGF